MITEDYVSFEIAKLLKEKGFDEPCDCYINGIFLNTITKYSDYGIKRKNSDKTDVYSAPTLQMAMKWFRETHNIGIFPATYYVSSGENIIHPYGVAIVNLITHELMCDNIMLSDTYEKAVKKGLEYCLKNLI